LSRTAPWQHIAWADADIRASIVGQWLGCYPFPRRRPSVIDKDPGILYLANLSDWPHSYR
jgi:hypothetical protein